MLTSAPVASFRPAAEVAVFRSRELSSTLSPCLLQSDGVTTYRIELCRTTSAWPAVLSREGPGAPGVVRRHRGLLHTISGCSSAYVFVLFVLPSSSFCSSPLLFRASVAFVVLGFSLVNLSRCIPCILVSWTGAILPVRGAHRLQSAECGTYSSTPHLRQ